MDMTAWLEYFVDGLSTQPKRVVERVIWLSATTL
jgi:hypothetical protein